MLPKWITSAFVKKNDALSQYESADIRSSSNPQDSSTHPKSELILRDIYSTPNRKTMIEVRTDGIYLRGMNKAAEDEFIPIKKGAGDIDKYEEVDEGIRCQIAQKITLLLPELGESSKSELMKYTIDVLRFIAQDELSRVRRIIAEEHKDLASAPRDVIQKLLWDQDLKVKLPILEFSPLLGDFELLDIMSNSPVPGVLEAIAKRKKISPKLSDAIVKSEHVPAITYLLENEGAQLSDAALSKIIDRAPQYVLWHEPLLKRPELTQKTINRIAEFISLSLIRILQEDKQIKPEVAQSLLQAVSSRLKSTQVDKERSAEIRAQEMFLLGELTQDEILRQLDYSEPEFVIFALSILSRLSKTTVQQMVRSQSPKVITALSWKAGLNMRGAIQMQLRLGRIHHSRVLNARDGVDYPLSDSEMLHYVDLFMEYNEE